MKIKFHPSFIALTLLVSLHQVAAQGTAFNYQGQLNSSGSPANGNYNLTFSLYNVKNGGVAAAGPVTTNGVIVSNGLFTVLIDFGPGALAGANNWLQIGVETNGGTSFTALIPRQQITPTPYAIYAETADAAGISGTVPNASLSGTYGNALTLNNAANSFSGDGSNLTGVNAATLGGFGVNSFWKVTGNFGTTPGINFVGTTDNQPLEFKVNGQRALRLEPNASNAPNLIAGSPENDVLTGIVGASIQGGVNNTNEANYGVIGGGSMNTLQTATVDNGSGVPEFGVIGGGSFNAIQATSPYSTIGGGNSDTVWGVNSTIGGGSQNVIGSSSIDDFGGGSHTIAGGVQNRINYQNYYSTIGGGINNFVDGTTATIAGGGGNAINWFGSSSHGNSIAGGTENEITTIGGNCAIGGGSDNSIIDSSLLGFSIIAGGQSNQVFGDYSAIGGGLNNTASGGFETVGGGSDNTANGDCTTISGGVDNVIQTNASFSFIGGGSNNIILLSAYGSANDSAIVGGANNQVEYGSGQTIGGGVANSIKSDGMSTIAGGSNNIISISGDSLYTTIGGGSQNFLGGGWCPECTIGGGVQNAIYWTFASSVVGGHANIVDSYSFSAIGGGFSNRIGNFGLFPFYGFSSVIAGGNGNFIEQSSGTIGGGGGNTVTATVDAIATKRCVRRNGERRYQQPRKRCLSVLSPAD